MIEYKSFVLENGLKVFVHEDPSSPQAVINILYNVGSRDESEEKTGFAHLFEHLMFGGSVNIPSYDEPLERAGGENNAFTSTDITNYYITIPSVNIETAFWLESDRMLSLSFEQKTLDVQKSVVIEEFKQRYLNQPYGDVWLKLRPLVYKEHPYKWATIGKEISHIESAEMQDVKDFFYKFYIPNNAILVIAGDITFDYAKALTEKWFGPIPAGTPYLRNLPAEPFQKEGRRQEVIADVPLDALYKVYHMPGRKDPEYYSYDLLSDILGRGKSSRLYDRLVKEKEIFSSISAHVSGTADPGLIIIEGKLNGSYTLEVGEAEVQKIIEELVAGNISDDEVTKVKNQSEASVLFGEVELLNRSMNLAFAAFLGDPEIVNKESEMIQQVTKESIIAAAKKTFRPENSSTLYYRAKSKVNEN